MTLNLSHISKNYGRLKAVDDVSLTVARGDNLAIIGESGCGKTTLVKIIMGLIKADQGTMSSAGANIQMVFQDPYTSLDPLYNVRSILKEALWRQKCMPAEEQEQRMQDMLKATDLPVDALNRFPHEFSGGERQRIAIARALLGEPKIVIFDEAVSSLDVLVQKQIMELLLRLKQEFQLTYIFISHNLRLVRHFSDKIAVMQNGRIIELASKEELFANPTHAYTQQLLNAAFNYVI